jgi:hypothetical protein
MTPSKDRWKDGSFLEATATYLEISKSRKDMRLTATKFYDSSLVDDNDDNLQFEPGFVIPPHFVYWRLPIEESYTVSPAGHPNALQLKPSELNLTGLDGNTGGPGGQTFVSRRQVHTLFSYTVDIDYEPNTVDEEAGISLFLTQVRYLVAVPLASD